MHSWLWAKHPFDHPHPIVNRVCGTELEALVYITMPELGSLDTRKARVTAKEVPKIFLFWPRPLSNFFERNLPVRWHQSSGVADCVQIDQYYGRVLLARRPAKDMRPPLILPLSKIVTPKGIIRDHRVPTWRQGISVRGKET